MHRKYADQTDRYWNAFLKQWDVIEKHLIDPIHGGWYAEISGEGNVKGGGGKANQWKANYHTSRGLMNGATVLGGKTAEPASAVLLAIGGCSPAPDIESRGIRERPCSERTGRALDRTQVVCTVLIISIRFSRRSDMRLIGSVWVVLGLLVGADLPQKDDVKNDLGKLQGSWAMVMFFVDGEEVPTDQVKTGELLIDDEEYRPKLGASVETATVHLNSSKNPKEIDFTYTTGFQKGKTTKGIYKLDGETLTICRGQTADKDRPTEFAAPAGSGLLLVVWKRASTAAGEKWKVIQAELKRFEATWHFVSIEIDGRQVPAEAFKEDSLVLNGKKYTLTVHGKTTVGSFRIDPSQKPKAIDITITDGPNKDKTAKGIYELTGDTQKICVAAPGKPRPTEFVSKPDSGSVIQVLRREKS
jgi:uncharacterized protein (TIGR03067 family)